MKEQLSRLLQHPQIWQAANIQQTQQGLPTGYKQLDQSLHHGGWPRSGLTELLYPAQGLGELQLLGPCLSRLSQQGCFVLLIAPPYQPYAPAWLSQGIDISRLKVVKPQNTREQLWAIEQALRCKACAAVLSWLGNHPHHSELRKLQLAAQANPGLAVIFRPQYAAQHASPAALRIRLQAQTDSLQLHIIKQRGGWSGQSVKLRLNKTLFEKQAPAKSCPHDYSQHHFQHHRQNHPHKNNENEISPDSQESIFSRKESAQTLKQYQSSTNTPIKWQ